MSFHSLLIKAILRSLFLITIFLSFAGFAFAAPGDLDPTFGSGGRVTTAVGTEDRGNAMVLQPDGKIVVGGRTRPGATRFDFALARYNADGSLDTSFGTGGTLLTPLNRANAPEDEILALVLQPDGKIIAVGSARAASGAFISTGIVRYNSNGSLDASFGNGGIVLINRVVDRAVVLQPDGKIVCGGGTGIAVEADFRISRFNPDGSLDATFGNGGNVDIDFNGSGDGVYALALQPDGKLVAAGRSRALGDDDNFAVARLNTDGSLDQTFGTGGKAVADFADNTDLGFAVALQPDGKIIVSGRALPEVNTFDFGLARFNANGTLDTTFGNGGKVTTNFLNGVDIAYAVKVQSNGKIVAAGVRGGTSTAFGLARYNADGSLDTTFGSGGKTETFFNGSDEARAMQIQPDGKIVAAGTANGGAIIGQFAVARYIGDDSGLPTPTPTPTPVPGGIEADVAVRPDGDGAIQSDDVVQIRRFLNGTQTPDPATNEFQRADSFPFADRGDGVLNSADVVQTRRYQNGTSPLQTAGGPLQPNRAQNLTDESNKTEDESNSPEGNLRQVRVESTSGSAGQTVTVNILVNAVGDESEYGFILNYDQGILSNPVIGAGNAGVSIRSCNKTASGRITCSVGGFLNNNTNSADAGIGEIQAGINQILMTVTFTVASKAPAGATSLTLSDVNAASDSPHLFTPKATGGMVTIVTPSFLFKLNACGNRLLYSTYTGAAMTGRL